MRKFEPVPPAANCLPECTSDDAILIGDEHVQMVWIAPYRRPPLLRSCSRLYTMRKFEPVPPATCRLPECASDDAILIGDEHVQMIWIAPHRRHRLPWSRS